MQTRIHNLADLTTLCFDGNTAGSGDGGTGAAATGTQGGNGTQGTGTSDATSGTGNAGANAAANTVVATVPRSEFDALNTKLNEALQREADREKKEKADQAKKAKEAGNFEELYTKAQQEVDALKPDVARAQEYAKAILAQVTRMMDGVPDYVQDLLKGQDPLAQFTWLTEHADKLKKQGGDNANNNSGAGSGGTAGTGSGATGSASGTSGANTNRGGGTNPNPAGNPTREELIAQEMRSLTASGDYGSLGRR